MKLGPAYKSIKNTIPILFYDNDMAAYFDTDLAQIHLSWLFQRLMKRFDNQKNKMQKEVIIDMLLFLAKDYI